MFQGIHHASFVISDLSRSLDFYCRVLGLKQLSDRPDLGYEGAWLAIGKQQLHLMCLATAAEEHSWEHGGRQRHVAFAVESLEPVLQRLQQNQIGFTRSRSGRIAAFVHDPDGNALEFIELDEQK